MGDWIKENKFETGLLLLVLIIGGAAYAMAGKWGAAYQEQVELYDQAKRTKQDYESRKPFPTEEKKEEFKDAVDEYRKVVKTLQLSMLSFRPKEFTNIAPSEFTDRLNAAVTELAQRYTDEEIDFPADKWRLGFEIYTDTPPRDGATAFLNYQLEAHRWLFTALADAKPSTLINVVRPELKVEKGEEMEPNPGNRRGPGRSAPSAPSGPYHTLPLELTFRAPEPAVRTFLSSLAGSKEHYFVINTLRIQNEKRGTPPKKDDVKFDDKPIGGATDSPFGSSFDLVVPDEDPQPVEPVVPAPEGGEVPPAGGEPPAGDPFPDADLPPVPDGGDEVGGDRVLGQVLGNEEVNVYLRLDLILFKEGGTLP